MKTFADNRIVSLFAKTGAAIFAAVLVVSLCLASLKAPIVNADSEIMVSLNSKSSNLGPGDIVLVDVLASKMPGITELGPIKFCFDSDKAEYVSFEMGKDLVNYLHNELQDNGEITITIMDKMMNTGTDGNSDEESSASFFRHFRRNRYRRSRISGSSCFRPLPRSGRFRVPQENTFRGLSGNGAR